MTAVDEPIKSIALILLLLLLLLLFLVEFASSPPETAAVAAVGLKDTDGAVTLFLLLPAPTLTCVSEFRRAAAAVVVMLLMLLLVRPMPATALVLSSLCDVERAIFIEGKEDAYYFVVDRRLSLIRRVVPAAAAFPWSMVHAYA